MMPLSQKASFLANVVTSFVVAIVYSSNCGTVHDVFMFNQHDVNSQVPLRDYALQKHPGENKAFRPKRMRAKER